MKRSVLFLASTIWLTLTIATCNVSMGQQVLPTKAYWVVETHTRDTVYSIVRFFDGNDRLLHEVRIRDLAIDITQKKYRKKLDMLLADYVTRTGNGVKKIRPETSV